MNLVIDIGNTAVKVAVFKGDRRIVSSANSLEKAMQEVRKIVKHDFPISHSIISSVAISPKELIKLLSSKTKLTRLSHKTMLPFANHYKTPGTLGLDRIASVAGGQKKFPDKNVLVIDAGTCIKYDFINRKSEYLGGSISPGLEMRFHALHNFTEQLPLLKPERIKAMTGNSTKNSILSGVIIGIVNEINGFINIYKSKHHELKVILTGGDAQFLGRQLKSSIFAAPYLTLEGLNEILKINAK